MRNSITYKYVGIATLILVSVQLSFGLLQSRWHYINQRDNLEQKINNKASFLSAVSIESILNLDFINLESLVRETTTDNDIIYSLITDSKGQPLTRYLDKKNPIIQDKVNKYGEKNILYIIQGIQKNTNTYQAEATITNENRIIGKVIIAYSHKNINKEFYREAALNLANSLLASTLLVILTSILFNRQVSMPLKKLTKNAEEIASGSFKHIIKPSNQANEISTLENAFNDMAAQLEETINGLNKNNHDLAITNTKLARATKLKDEFLANMSHELRTPLNAILGLSEALVDETYGSLTARQLKSLSTIHHSGEHLLSLINDILDLAKIESGKEELYITSVNLEYLCRSSLEFVQELAYQKNIKLQLQIESQSPYIFLDERKIKQVLINLLTNAVKFTLDNGNVILKAWLDKIHKKTYFQVIDTGIGISTEDISKIFESFIQIESSLARSYAGTGLGLALVKNIIELHNGIVEVESELEKGSKFTIIIPWQKHSEEVALPRFTNSLETPSSTEDSSTEDSSEALILITDDNEANILTISDYLKAKGYRLIYASNGSEAIKVTQKMNPDLILMDIQMPIMDGLEASYQLKQNPATASIPIIALTALSMPGDQEKCLDAGVDSYITKPVNLKKLVISIEKQLENQTQKA